MRKIVVIYLLLVSIFLLCPKSALAYIPHYGVVKGVTTVSALVPSKVSVEKSGATANVYNILADISQRVIITIRLRDKDGNPLKNIKVELVSNRGAIDKIMAVKAQNGDISVLLPGEQSEPNIATTNDDGTAFFKVSSTVPGEATLTAIADNVVELPSIKITFLPLPFPTNITVSIEVPAFINPQGKIVLFRPASLVIDKEKLINTGVEVRIPTSLFLTICLLIILMPATLLIILNLFRKVKKAEEKELRYLEMEKRFVETLDKADKKT